MDSVKRGEMIKKTQKYKKIYFCVLGCNPLLLATGIALALCRMSVYAVISISFSLGALAFAFIPFAKYTCWYPINSMQPNIFSLAKMEWKKNGSLLTVFYEGDGIWSICLSGQKEELFDLTGYLFPKSYICCYFLRNLHYPEINRRKIKFYRWFRPMKLSNKKLPERLGIRFIFKNREKVIWLAKKRKTKVSAICDFILIAPYYRHHMFAYTASYPYRYIDEEIYEMDKRKYGRGIKGVNKSTLRNENNNTKDKK